MATIDVAKSRIQAQNSKSIMEYTSTIQALMRLDGQRNWQRCIKGFNQRLFGWVLVEQWLLLLLRPCVRLLIRCR